MQIKKYIYAAIITTFSAASYASAPLWLIIPTADSYTHQTVAENITSSVRYTVINQSRKPKNIVLYPTNGLKQSSSCILAPKGQAGSSCIISFQIIGKDLPRSGLTTGPILCQGNIDGTANQNQCYSPSPQNVLNIKKAPPLQNWNSWGQNINNDHYNLNSGIYEKQDVRKLINLCKIDYTEGSIADAPRSRSTSSKPIIVGDVIYWTAFAGKIGAHQIIRDKNGSFIGCNEKWVKDVSVLTDLSGAPLTSAPSVRSSPAFYRRQNNEATLLYTAYNSIFSLPSDIWFSTPPIAFALDAATGEKLWQIELVDELSVAPNGDTVAPTTTASPSVYHNTAFIGLASLNNALNTPPNNLNLTFRGHMIALDLGGNGLAPDMPSIKWVQYTIPPKPNHYENGQWFAGGGVWASRPSVIPELDLVIFGSGQLYNYPDFTTDCMERSEITDFGTFLTTKKGETGKGAQECLLETENKLKGMGITHPLATNSIIALRMSDGAYVWHVPTAGIDSWQVSCGPEGNQEPCNVPVVGPDWDVGGSSPLIATLPKLGKVVISHNKGGQIFWIAASTGAVIRRADVCTGSASGGIHWGLSYDPSTQTIFAACSGGLDAPSFSSSVSFLSRLANGDGYCKMGYLNAIDAKTGKLKWQTIPPASQIYPVGSADCPDVEYKIDRQFKHGLGFDVILKNQIFNVPVNQLPESNLIPLKNQGKARSNGVPAVSNGIVYWPVYYGVLYALDATTGKFIAQMNCDAGALYTAGPSTANGIVSFGCGYGTANPSDVGNSIMVYGFEKAITHKAN